MGVVAVAAAAAAAAAVAAAAAAAAACSGSRSRHHCTNYQPATNTHKQGSLQANVQVPLSFHHLHSTQTTVQKNIKNNSKTINKCLNNIFWVQSSFFTYFLFEFLIEYHNTCMLAKTTA